LCLQEVIVLSSDEEAPSTPPKKDVAPKPIKREWLPPNKRYGRGFRFELPPIVPESGSDTGTINIKYSQFNNIL